MERPAVAGVKKLEGAPLVLATLAVSALQCLRRVFIGRLHATPRIALWLKNVGSALLRHPIRNLRWAQPLGWARESVVLLCMQALDGHIEMRWQRPWFWPFHKALVSRGEKVPTYIPLANEFAKKFAQIAGGSAMSMLPEIIFDIPGTAHCIGGCVIADSPEHGVIDPGTGSLAIRTCTSLWIRRSGQPRRKPQPYHHCACGASHELHTPGLADGMGRHRSLACHPRFTGDLLADFSMSRHCPAGSK